MLPKPGATLTILISVLAFTSCSGRKGADTTLDAAQWRTDLKFLAENLPQKHVNAFHAITKEQFAAEVASLDAALPQLDPDASVVRMMKLVAMVADGHTHLDLPNARPRYPIEVDWFGDELRIIAADAGGVPILGSRIIAINGIPVGDVMSKLAPLVPQGQTAGRTRYTSTTFVTNPVVLHGIGVTPTADNASFTVILPKGDTVTRALTPRDLNQPVAPQVVANPAPLYARHPEVGWWSYVVPDGSSVYISFKAYPPAGELDRAAQSLKESLSGNRVQRIVFDMRRNSGSDFDRFRRAILPVLRDTAVNAGKHDMFVVTGPGTFSAATVNALDLRKAGAILVGEPTGTPPNTFTAHGEFRLPASKLRVTFATKYEKFGEDGDASVTPDIPASATWAQFVSGQDSALSIALSGAGRPPRRPIPSPADSTNAKK